MVCEIALHVVFKLFLRQDLCSSGENPRSAKRSIFDESFCCSNFPVSASIVRSCCSSWVLPAFWLCATATTANIPNVDNRTLIFRILPILRKDPKPRNGARKPIGRKRRVMSAAATARISKATKALWAKFRAAKAKGKH